MQTGPKLGRASRLASSKRSARRPALVVVLMLTAGMLGCQADKEDAAAKDLLLVIGGQEKPLPRERLVQIQGFADGTVACDRQTVGLDGIAGAIALRHGTNPDLIAVLDLSPTVSCRQLEEILVAVREGGITNVAFVKDLPTDATAVPFMLPPVDLKLPAVPAEMMLTVGIGSEGNLSVDGEVLAREDWVRFVGERLQNVKGLVITIDPADGARYGDFFSAMLALRDAGATRISLWGRLRVG